MKIRFPVRTLATAALITALLCLLGPWSLPIGPVPVSLASLGVYLSAYLLGPKLAALSYLGYLVLGLAGVPVFSGFAGGLWRLAGPTGGYLVGMLPMALICGTVAEKSSRHPLPCLMGMAAGTLVNYIFGTFWYCLQTDTGIWAAFAVCVVPFVLFDAMKIALTLILGAPLHRRLRRAGYMI